MTVRDSLPIVDIRAWSDGDGDGARDSVAAAIDGACRDPGFFYVTGHGVPLDLVARVDRLAREFFAQADAAKAVISMDRGGRAWRGWFPVGGELTSGRPDQKEGIYFGAELGPDDPRVAAAVPMHGANLFPVEPAALRGAVLHYMAECTRVGHVLAAAMSRALGLPDDWFDANLTSDPTVLFRIFHYPGGSGADDDWGVGEHTDYGLLTILAQDHTGGLSIHSPSGWIDAPPIRGTFVVNVGDMLERVTRGRYRSTPHRVRNTSGADRISLAFFFDPSWDTEVLPVATAGEVTARTRPRWDGADPHAFHGTYGDYLLGKVAKVFPDLGRDALG